MESVTVNYRVYALRHCLLYVQANGTVLQVIGDHVSRIGRDTAASEITYARRHNYLRYRELCSQTRYEDGTVTANNQVRRLVAA